MYLHMVQCVEMYWSFARSSGLHLDGSEARAWRKEHPQGDAVSTSQVLLEVGLTVMFPELLSIR